MRSITLLTTGMAAVMGVCIGLAGVAGAQDVPQPPSRIQICAATDIAAVDDLLSQLSTEQLVQRLAPLASLTVPRNPKGVELAESVDIGDVRDALGCPDETRPTPTGTATPTPTATGTPTADPTTTPPVTDFPAPGGGDGFGQVGGAPTGPAETGGGPA